MKPGELKGPSHKDGGIILEAEGGEYIVKKSSVDKLGKGTLDHINKTGTLPKAKKGGAIKKKYTAGNSIKTYGSGGYVEGK